MRRAGRRAAPHMCPSPSERSGSSERGPLRRDRHPLRADAATRAVRRGSGRGLVPAAPAFGLHADAHRRVQTVRRDREGRLRDDRGQARARRGARRGGGAALAAAAGRRRRGRACRRQVSGADGRDPDERRQRQRGEAARTGRPLCAAHLHGRGRRGLQACAGAVPACGHRARARSARGNADRRTRLGRARRLERQIAGRLGRPGRTGVAVPGRRTAPCARSRARGRAGGLMARVAVVGLGGMGSRIARRLIDARHELTVWNRTAAKAEPLGVPVAESPAEAASNADVVITMVADAPALQAVTEGPGGVAAGAGEQTTVIEMSTVGPAAIERLASVLRTNLLDAPVLGSFSEAESGTLSIFVGGDENVFQRHRELLEVLGNPLYVGPSGAGAAAKLVANSTLFTVIGAVGEALALADALGLSRKKAFEVLGRTALAEQAERRRPAIESGEFPVRFSVRLARKDADLIAELELDLRLVAAARSWLADTEGEERDYAAVLERITRR